MADNREENNENHENNHNALPNYFEDAAFSLVITMGLAIATMFWIQTVLMYREMIERDQFHSGERGYWFIRKIIRENK